MSLYNLHPWRYLKLAWKRAMSNLL